MVVYENSRQPLLSDGRKLKDCKYKDLLLHTDTLCVTVTYFVSGFLWLSRCLICIFLRLLRKCFDGSYIANPYKSIKSMMKILKITFIMVQKHAIALSL